MGLLKIRVALGSRYVRTGTWKSCEENGVPWGFAGTIDLSEERGAVKGLWAEWQRPVLILVPDLPPAGYINLHFVTTPWTRVLPV